MDTHRCHIEGAVLDGHLSLIVELLSFHTVEQRYMLGSHVEGPKLIQVMFMLFLCQHVHCTFTLYIYIYLPSPHCTRHLYWTSYSLHHNSSTKLEYNQVHIFAEIHISHLSYLMVVLIYLK